jgi:hypothetical protein
MVEIGFTLNKLEVVEHNGQDNRRRPLLTFRCFCGNTKRVRAWEFEQGTYKSCGCLPHPGNRLGKFTRRYGPDSPHWKGHGEISSQFWSRIKGHAKARTLPFEISIEEGWSLFLAQNRLCALTGDPLQFGKTVKEQRAGKTTASLDRIDSKLGYVLGNVQWVHKTVNLLKMDLPQQEFIEWCQKVATRYPR